MKELRQKEIANHSVLLDCLLIGTVITLSIIPYVGQIGFSSDDWAFLGYFSTATDQSLLSLYRAAVSPVHAMRPVFILYLSVLYWIFGLNPLGYHVVNGIVLALGIVLFYLVLVKLTRQRFLAFTVALVYGLLPHYSTNRFWGVSLPIVLSMTLYFLSLYCDLLVVSSRGIHQKIWKFAAVLSLLIGCLSYEIFLPLYIFNLWLIYHYVSQSNSIAQNENVAVRPIVGLFLINLAAIVAIITFKLTTTVRMGQISPKWQAIWFTRLIARASKVSYGDFGLGVIGSATKLLQHQFNWITLVFAGLISLLVFLYLSQLLNLEQILLPRVKLLKVAGLGIGVFILGYTIFLSNSNALITATGIGNRVAIAASIGVALSLVAGIYLISSFLPSQRLTNQFFCVLITLLCTSNFIINTSVATYWINSYQQQQKLLSDIHRELPSLPTGVTLILDGICPYSGPAVVFESNWDLAGALMTIYRDYTLRADVVTSNLQVEADALSTRLYGSIYTRYPYTDRLFIYHAGRKTVHPIANAESARTYFQYITPDRSNGCPSGEPGYGVKIL